MMLKTLNSTFVKQTVHTIGRGPVLSWNGHLQNGQE